MVDVQPVVEEQRPAQGSETVLLVEDDESILNLGVAILESFGYTVLPAQSPEQALALIRQHTRPIHLLDYRHCHAGNERQGFERQGRRPATGDQGDIHVGLHG